MPKDIFEDIKNMLGYNYISDIPYHRSEVLRLIKKMELSVYPLKQLKDLSEYICVPLNKLI